MMQLNCQIILQFLSEEHLHKYYTHTAPPGRDGAFTDPPVFTPQKLTDQKATADHAAVLLEKRFSNPAPRKETTVLLVDEVRTSVILEGRS